MALIESHPDRVILFTQNIVNSWSTVIPEAAGRVEKFFDDVEQAVKGLDIPNVITKRIELETTRETERAKGLYVRVALLVRGTVAPINNHNIYFSAQDFGKHLILSRYVEENSKVAYSPFEKEALSAYFSLVNAAMLAVVKQFTTELKQDFSKINTQSKGIIDIV